MSTPAMEQAIIATIEEQGTSDLATIQIPVAELAVNASSSRTVIIFLTYDSMNQAFEMSGRYGSMRSAREITPWGTPQTAMLFVARRPIDSMLTLTFSPTATEPVAWRAVGIVIDAQPVSNSVPPVLPVDGPYVLDAAWTRPDDEHSMRVAFFGSAMDVPQMSNAGINTVTSVIDGNHWINAYGWNQAGATAMGVGPWFYTELRLTWNNISMRPPPTDSDDFWAPPAPCDAADILLINNNMMAPSWDASVATVFAEPDTLLLNFTEEDGTRWMLNDLDGWWTLPPPELPDLQRPGYLDGSFPVDGRYLPRVITMRGTVWPGDDVSVAVPRLRILRTLDAVRGGALLVVKEPVWPKQAWVWLADQPRVTTTDTSGKTEFEVQLRAVDPIKYHSGQAGLREYDLPWAGALDGRDYTQDPIVGERFRPNPFRRFTKDAIEIVAAEVVNSGTANVYPRFFIYGPATNVAIVNRNTQQRMVFQGTLPEGKMLIVDCYWRIVTMSDSTTSLVPFNRLNELEGENRRWMLRLSSPWMYLQPGVNEMYYQASGTNVPTPAPIPTPKADEIPVNATQCWIMFRSGWMGS